MSISLSPTSPRLRSILWSTVVLGWTILAASPAAAVVVGYGKVKSTTDKVIDPTPGNTKVVVCSVGPLAVQQDDIVSGHMQLEMTYPGTPHVMTAAGIVIGTNANVVDSTSSGYVGMLSRFCATNLHPAEEGSTEIHTRTGSYKVGAGVSSVYVNVVAYAASLGSNPPNLVIPADYAEIVAVVERGITRLETSTFHLPQSGGEWVVPIDTTTHVQYSLGPVTIPANTMVDVRFQVESTSEAPSSNDHQRLGRYTVLGTSSSDTSGTTFTEQMQASVPRYYEHHNAWSHVGGAFFPDQTTGAYINSVLYGRGGAASPALIIEPPSSTLYGHMVVEMRPTVAGRYWQDRTRNTSTVTTTKKVLYSVGPISCTADDVVEVRYAAILQGPSGLVPFDSTIIRATSATATTGVTVQRPLYRKIGPGYDYTAVVHSTAEKFTSAASGQYYNVVAWVPSGSSSINVVDWGELEAVKR